MVNLVLRARLHASSARSDFPHLFIFTCLQAVTTGSMDFNVMEMLKEKCQSTVLDDCGLNASLAGDTDARNATLGAGLTHEGMSPLIPVITAVYSMVFVVGLVGNCLVMYVIIR